MLIMNFLVAGGILAFLIVAAVGAIGITVFTAVSVNKINKRQAEIKAEQANNPAEEAQEAPAEETQEKPQEQPAEEAPEPPVEENPEEESQPTEEAQPEETETPQEEAQPANEAQVAPAPVAPEAQGEDDGEEIVAKVNEETGELEFFAYNRSFTSRVIQANDETQSRYERIKNHLLSFKGVKSRVSWGYDAFRKGREAIATILIKGKTLNVYLALDPKEYADTKYRFEDVSDVKKYADVPMRCKVKNNLNEKYCMELIDILMAKMSLELGTEQTENYHKPYETDEQLLKEDLIRLTKTNRPSQFAKPAQEEDSPREEPVEKPQVVEDSTVELAEDTTSDQPVEETTEVIAEDTQDEHQADEVVEEVQPEDTEAPAEETQAEEEPQEEIKPAETQEELEEVQKEEVTVEEAQDLVSDKLAEEVTETVYEDVKGNKKGVVNIDTISENFNNGDTVTLKDLKEKGLISPKCDSYKVLARGTLNKKLTVVANDFSSNATKMILVTGGTVKKIKKQ